MAKISSFEVRDLILHPGSDTAHPSHPSLLYYCTDEIRGSENISVLDIIKALFEWIVVESTKMGNGQGKISFYCSY